uniref:Uncharacterized protein n=1 Tax=Rhizophora mucronata TaxID=61149 RepID=A0A2P2QKV5_RHIMU
MKQQNPRTYNALSPPKDSKLTRNVFLYLAKGRIEGQLTEGLSQSIIFSWVEKVNMENLEVHSYNDVYMFPDACFHGLP